MLLILKIFLQLKLMRLCSALRNYVCTKDVFTKFGDRDNLLNNKKTCHANRIYTYMKKISVLCLTFPAYFERNLHLGRIKHTYNFRIVVREQSVSGFAVYRE